MMLLAVRFVVDARPYTEVRFLILLLFEQLDFPIAVLRLFGVLFGVWGAFL